MDLISSTVSKIISEVECVLVYDKRLFQDNSRPNKYNLVSGGKTEDCFMSKIAAWYDQSDIKALEFKLVDFKGVSIRFNRKHFNIENNKLILKSEKAISIYYRHKVEEKKSYKMSLISYLCENMDKFVIEKIELIDIENKRNALTKKSDLPISSIPTVREFLPTYEKILYLQNPDTVTRKINLITKVFSGFLDLRLDEIKGSHLIQFVDGYRRVRTKTETQHDDSPFTKKLSTLKDYICTFRAMLKESAEYSSHPFELCPTLYNKKLSFKINNESDNYLTREDITKFFNGLTQRDKELTSIRSNNCQFFDYLTPLTSTLLASGLRPGYGMRLRISDINFEAKILMVRGKNGKIIKDEVVHISPELEWILREWLKHDIHISNPCDWLFPSPQIQGRHLVEYKTAFTTFRNKYGLTNIVMKQTRHTFATYFTIITGDIRKTQKALHHKQLKTTQRYARVLESDLANDINQLASQLIPLNQMSNPQ